MKQNFKYNRIPAPMKELWKDWETGRHLSLPWFFDIFEGFQDLCPVVSFTDFESEFFKALKLEFQKRKIKAEYLITAEDFFKLNSILPLLEEGLCLSIVIFKPLGAEVVQKIKSLGRFMDQLKFILIVRRDWDYENTYRSLPYFIRSELFVDFPLPVHTKTEFSKVFGPGFLLKLYEKVSGDKLPFFSIDESRDIVRSFKRLFPDHHFNSYCPNLIFYNEFLNYNISHMDFESSCLESPEPGKNCKLSIVVEDQRGFEDIVEGLASDSLQNPDQIEILTWNSQSNESQPKGSQRRTNPLGKISVRSFQVSVKNSKRAFSKAMVNNFLATKATGEFLFFANCEKPGNFDSLLNIFEPFHSGISKRGLNGENKELKDRREGDFNDFNFLFQKKLLFFRKEKFLKTGGFDPLFSDSSLVFLDTFFRYSSGGGTVLLKDCFSPFSHSFFSSKSFFLKNDPEGMGFFSEKPFLFHKYLCEESFISRFGKPKKERFSFLKREKNHHFVKRMFEFFFYPIHSRILCFIHYFFTASLFYDSRYGRKYFLKQLLSLKFKKKRK